MLTIRNLYNIIGDRVETSKHSGYTAPKDFAGFFISTDQVGSATNILNKSTCLCSGFQLPTPYGLRELKQRNIDMNNLTFNNQKIELINVNNQPYMTQTQIGLALKYANISKVSNLFNAHKDEFTPEMSMLIKQGRTQVRVFNLRGCHLLAMFSKTEVAKDFRRWVLDLIESHNKAISKIETVDMKAIGGMVKKCCAVAVRDEVKEQISNLILKAEPLKPFQDVSDETILRGLYDWYATKHKDYIKAIKDLTTENDLLKSKIAKIKQTIN